jgi:tetratricopeptide (TPR) repeat protein
VHTTLANLYRRQGRYSEAEPLYQRALAAYERALGPDHVSLMLPLDSLATLYMSRGRYRHTLGPEHPDTARTLNKLNPAGETRWWASSTRGLAFRRGSVMTRSMRSSTTVAML